MAKRRTISDAYEGLVEAAHQVSRDLQLLIDEKKASLQRDAPKLSSEAIHDRRKEIDGLDLMRQTLANELDQRTPKAPYLRYLLDGIAIFGSIASIATAAPALDDGQNPTPREQELCASILDHIDIANKHAADLEAETTPHDGQLSDSDQPENDETEQTIEDPDEALKTLLNNFDDHTTEQQSQLFNDLNPDQQQQLFNDLNPDQQQQLFTNLDERHQEQLFTNFDRSQRQRLFGDLDQSQQQQLFNALNRDQRSELLNDHTTGQRVQLLNALGLRQQQQFFNALNRDHRSELFAHLGESQRLQLFDNFGESQRRQLFTDLNRDQRSQLFADLNQSQRSQLFSALSRGRRRLLFDALTQEQREALTPSERGAFGV